jgi:hypothetical protein
MTKYTTTTEARQAATAAGYTENLTHSLVNVMVAGVRYYYWVTL